MSAAVVAPALVASPAAAAVSDLLGEASAQFARDYVLPKVSDLPPLASHMHPNNGSSYRPGPLSESEYEQLIEHGWVIKHNLLPVERLKPVKDDIAQVVDQVANELFAAGKISDKCENASFYERLSKLEAQWPSASVLVHKRGILPAAVSELWSSAPLLSVAQQVLGDEIVGHPVWNIRSKVPRQGQATVPWHQDNAYLNRACWEKYQLTAWVPLIDANMHNGCMQVLSGGHRMGVTVGHTCCVGGTWYVEMHVQDAADKLQSNGRVVTCEVPQGSVLFLNNVIPHRSLENHSDSIRWSLDLRWQKAGEDNGFWGIKESIPMFGRDPVTGTLIPDYKPDWATWAKINRNALQAAAAAKAGLIKATGEAKEDEAKATTNPAETKEVEVDPFDTTISGPWMGQWELVNHNRHTAQFKQENAGSWTKS